MVKPATNDILNNVFVYLLSDAQEAGINPEGYATNLLSAFLNNDTFFSSAIQGQDPNIVDAIYSIPRVPTRWDSIADSLVQSAMDGDLEALADLAKAPEGTGVSLEQIDAFKTNAFYQNLDVELVVDREAPRELRGLASIKRKILAAEDSLIGAPEIKQAPIKGNIVSLQYDFETRLAALTGQEREIAENVVFPAAERLPDPVIEPVEEPVELPQLTREEVIAKLHEFQAMEATIGLDTYAQGFILLNPDYANFFAAVEQSGGVAVNSLAIQLEEALNETPDVLEAMITLSEDSEKLAALTEAIGEEQGATDLILSLAQENGYEIHAISPHIPTSLEGPDIPEINDTIGNLTMTPPVAGETIDISPDISPEQAPPAFDAPPSMLFGLVSGAGAAIRSDADFAADTATTAPEPLDPAIGAAEINNSIPPSLKAHFSDMTGADYVVANLATEAENSEPEMTAYTVQSGDNLWNIAKDHYGLMSYKDIMRAVDHMAHANGLEKGTDANWIKPGMEINMPSADQIKLPTNTLDWNALQNDPKLGPSARTTALTNG